AVHGVTHDAEACAVARVVYGPARLRGLEDVSQRALGVVDLRLEVVALPAAKPVEEPWRIQLETGANHPAELLIRMTADQAPHRAAIAGIVDRIDLMQGAHDLGRTPSLVDTQIGDDVGSLEAAVGVRCGHRSSCGAIYNQRLARRFHGNRAGEAVAELGGVAHHEPAAIARIRTGECAQ